MNQERKRRSGGYDPHLQSPFDGYLIIILRQTIDGRIEIIHNKIMCIQKKGAYNS